MKLGLLWKRHGSLALTIGACAGVGLSCYLTGKAVLEADKIMKDLSDEELKSVDTRKKLIKIYVKPFASFCATTACILSNYMMNKKVQNGLIAAYGIAASSLESWKIKMGVEEETRIEQEIDEDNILANIEALLEIPHGEEDELWIDDYREEPYWGTKSDILFGKDELNRDLLDPNFSRHSGYADMEVFYSHVKGGSKPQDRLRGWDVDYLIDLDIPMLEVDWNPNYIYTDPKSGAKIKCNRIYWNVGPLMNFWNYYDIRRKSVEEQNKWVRENS